MVTVVGSTAKVDGIDPQKVVQALPSFQRQNTGGARSAEPEQQLRTDISASGRLKSMAAATLDAAQRLTKDQTWSATKAQSSDERVVQAVSDHAKPGTYSVAVDSVAMAQATATATFSSLSTVVGIGTLKIELGSWNASQSTFSTNPNWPKANVTFGPKDNSLERVRDKINAAGIGVIASVVSDATGSRLVLRSTSTGEANGFKVEAEAGEGMDADTASTLSAMGFDPSRVQGGAEQVQPARDAKLRVDGRELTSSQNLVDDEASGLSLRVKSASEKPVEIRVEPDADGIRHDIQAFALTHNELSRQLAQSPESDDETTKVARELTSRVREAFSAPEAGDGSPSLRGIGLRMDEAGELSVDTDRLTQAIASRPDQVRRLFTGGESGKEGLAARLADIRLPEPQAATAPAAAPADTPAGPRPDDGARTAAGTLFRQKLLEQYAPANDEDGEKNRAGAELLIQANEA